MKIEFNQKELISLLRSTILQYRNFEEEEITFTVSDEEKTIFVTIHGNKAPQITIITNFDPSDS